MGSETILGEAIHSEYVKTVPCDSGYCDPQDEK